MEHGPVDVVVLAIGEPNFEGSMLAELERLAQQGTIRVLDAMVLVKDESGARISLNIEDLPETERDKLGFIESGTRGLFDSEDADMLWEGMASGSAVVALAIESAWAVPLLNSMAASGAEIAFDWRIPGPVIDEALESVHA